MMMNFFSVFSSKAVQPQSARPSENPRNWRCQLGTFWQDIEEAGSVLKARRLVPSEIRVQRRAGSTASPDGTATDKARTISAPRPGIRRKPMRHDLRRSTDPAGHLPISCHPKARR